MSSVTVKVIADYDYIYNLMIMVMNTLHLENMVVIT